MFDQFFPKKKTSLSETLLEQVEKSIGIKINTDDGVNLMLNGHYYMIAQGSYIHKGDKNYVGWPDETICLMNTEDPLVVLFHEIAHATGSEDRLNRPTLRLDIYRTDHVSRNYEEQVAENTALRLLKHYKLDTQERIAKAQQYCNLYTIPSGYYESMHNDVDKAFNYILKYWFKDLYFNPMEQEKSLMEKLKEFMKVA